MKGKCKQDFEKWYLKEYNKQKYVNYEFPHLDDFNILYLSMQWGVIVDFFDSVGITIEIDAGCLRYDTEDADICYQGGVRGYPFTEVKDTRLEARAAAIEKATEIYNEKFADTK